MLFYKEKWANLEVYNDLDERLVNLFRMVKYHPDELIKEFRWMIASRKMFAECLESKPVTDIQKAVKFFYILTRSFGGACRHFDTARKGTGGAVKSHQNIMNRVEVISHRLDKVSIENLSFSKLIPRYDYEGAFFYCDPPYSTGVGYDTTSTADFDHEGLRDILKNIKGRFLLSYDDSPKVRELYKDFNKIELVRQKGINNKNPISREYKELLIANYNIT